MVQLFIKDGITSKNAFLVFLIKLGLSIIGIFTALGFTDTAVVILLKQKGLTDIQNSLVLSLNIFAFSLGCFLIIPLLKKFSSKTVILISSTGVTLTLLALSFVL